MNAYRDQISNLSKKRGFIMLGENVDKDRIIYQLWKLLDDIDTLDDMSKDDDKGFRSSVYRIQQKRHGVLVQEQVDELYKVYHPEL